MKKLLLSSIIMFGICGFATAQKTTGKTVKPATVVSTISPATDVSAEAIEAQDKAPVSDLALPATGADAKAANAEAAQKKQMKQKQAGAKKVNDAGELVEEAEMTPAKQMEMRKAAAKKATATAPKKTVDN